MTDATPSEARVFGLDPGKHVRLFRRLFGRLGLLVLLPLTGIQLFWWSSSEARPPHAALACVLTLLGLVAFLVVVLWLVLWAGSSRYRLLLAPSWVASYPNGSVRQQVNRHDLAHLCESALGLVLVKQCGTTFRIPRSLNGYEAVRKQLLTWAPLTPKSDPQFRDWLGLVRKLTLLALCALVVLAGGVLLGLLNVLVAFVLQGL
jgi:hypothetical protein